MENEDLTEKLIQRATENEHSKFEFLESIEGYIASRIYSKAISKVISHFRKIKKIMFNTYVKTVSSGKDDVEGILALKECETIINFYEDELDIVYDIRDEFKSYVFYKGFFKVLFGAKREDEELVDFRTIGKE